MTAGALAAVFYLRAGFLADARAARDVSAAPFMPAAEAGAWRRDMRAAALQWRALDAAAVAATHSATTGVDVAGVHAPGGALTRPPASSAA